MSRAMSFFSCLIVASGIFSPLPAQIPDWTYQGNQASAALGTWVSGAGDVNGDGFDDVIVSATGHDGTNVDEGLVLLFLGSAAGLSPSPDWSVSGTSAGAQLSARGRAGDINGDGYDDVLLSDGRLFFGSSNGVSPAFQQTTFTNRSGPFISLDFDGDGYGDIKWGMDLWHGSPSGLSPRGVSLWKYVKGSAHVLSDLTGDGNVDLVVALDPSWEDLVVDEGSALHMFLGRPNGLSRSQPFISDFTWTHASPSLSAVGDVDGDGYNDFLLALRGDPDVVPQPGWFSFVSYFRGSSSGFVAPGNGPFYGSGDSVLRDMDGAGDVNGDGYDDLLIVDEGHLGRRVRVYAGGPGGPAATIAVLWGLDLYPYYSKLASAAGDVNGDGYDDLIVGSPGFSAGEAGEGRASLFLGRASWPAPSPVPEFSFDDHLLVDDVADEELFNFFNLMAPPSISGYILVEIESSPGVVESLCSRRPDFYRDSYLQLAVGGGSRVSGSWDKWYRSANGGWKGPVTDGLFNYFGSSCSAPYAWCAEWGLGSIYLRTDPAATQECEVSNVSTGCGTGGLQRIRVGPDRLSTCGF